MHGWKGVEIYPYVVFTYKVHTPLHEMQYFLQCGNWSMKIKFISYYLSLRNILDLESLFLFPSVFRVGWNKTNFLKIEFQGKMQMYLKGKGSQKSEMIIISRSYSLHSVCAPHLVQTQLPNIHIFAFYKISLSYKLVSTRKTELT